MERNLDDLECVVATMHDLIVEIYQSANDPIRVRELAADALDLFEDDNEHTADILEFTLTKGNA
jgi:hypothetical protein